MNTFLSDIHTSFWFPEQASSFAHRIDFLYDAILWISIAFFVPIVIALGWFMYKYRARPGYKGSPEALHNTTLEITWTVVPTFIVVWIFWEGASGYLEMMTIPDDSININVTARQFAWGFRYANGGEDEKLHLPVDTNVKLTMRSNDVLHSFFVPAFRAKRDVVPGRYNYMWFRPIKTGEYDLFCTEYCGDNHSTMKTKVVVHTQEDFDKFLANAVKEPEDIVARGQWLYERKGCKGCHYAGAQGAPGPGPSYNGSWGKTVSLAAGGEAKFDETYVNNAIMNPQKEARKGYENKGAMPSYTGQLKAEQVEALIAFIKSLETTEPPKN